MAWVTGLGAVSCSGRSVDELWSSRERTGIGTGGLGRVAGFEDDNRALEFCASAAGEAMREAGWSTLTADDGLILSTTTGLFLQWDRAFAAYVAGQIERSEFRARFMNQPLSVLGDQLRARVGTPGAFTVLTSACSASTQALGVAAMWLKSGRVKRVLVGGVEVLCDLTTEGFRSLQLLSVAPATPFDRARVGINLSEGAAFLCLENAASARAHARVSGYGFTTDAFHMTGPHPEGDGSYRAMKRALEVAGLESVDWVHAHGTGSQANDAAEGLAISRLFGEAGPWVSSTKWLHGHALGASGALESVLALRAMSEGLVLRTRGLVDPDPRIQIRHPSEDLSVRPRHVLKNTLGFGGTNAAVIFSEAR